MLIAFWPGWLAFAIVGLSLTYLSGCQPVVLSANQVAATVLMAAVAVVVSSGARRVLFETLHWMSAGYELAFRQSDELRNKSAQLEAAFKSLNQTSFALARANEQLEIMMKFAEDARRSKQEF